MSYEPLHHKYRPQTFADLVGQETIALTLINGIKQEKIAPAYLFTGPRGTGKTSSARILAKSLNCLDRNKPTPTPCGQCEVCLAIAQGTALDVIEIDAASNTGVDNIREIIERSRFAPVQCRYKVYAIDECHMLSTAAFNALLKTLEEPPPRVVFVLATTDPQRVLSTIISRCQRFDYRPIPLEEMVDHLMYIADEEDINIEREAIPLIAQIANGGLRDAESLLDQLSLLPDFITVEKIWDLVGAVPERDLLELLKAIRSDRHIEIIQQCRSLLDRGREPLIVLQNLASFYLNLLIAKTAPHSRQMVAVTEACWQELRSEAANWDITLILRGQQHLKAAEVQLKHTTQARLWLEVTLLGLLPGANSLPSVVSFPSAIHSPPPLAKVEKVATTAPPAKIQTQPQIQSHPTAKTIPQQERQPNNNPTISIVPVPKETPISAKAIAQPLKTNTNTNMESSPQIDSQTKAIATTTSIADQEIWHRVVDCIHLPMTRALLVQQCHLISLNDSSAIVGISSAKLRRLHQAKVTNIETAFEKVCQRKIKVQLEVAKKEEVRSQDKGVSRNARTGVRNHFDNQLEVKNTVPNPPTVTPVSSSNGIQSPSPSIERQNIPQPPAPKTTPQTINQNRDLPERGAPKPNRHHLLENKTIQFNPILNPPVSASTATKSENKLFDNIPQSVSPAPLPSPIESNQPKSPEVNATNSFEEDLDSDELQKAIANLTQLFEGELVQLDNIPHQLNQSPATVTEDNQIDEEEDEDDIPF